MSSNIVIIKEYDTPDLDCEYVDDKTGYPIPLINTKIKSSIMPTNSTYKTPLVVSKINEAEATFTLTPPLDYLSKGFYKIDVLFTDTNTGRQVASDTFTLRVVQAITEPEDL